MKKITLLFAILFSLAGFSQSNVTFQVDMNGYTGASFTTPEVNGQYNGWCGNCNAMTDANMDGIWEVTVQISDSTEYKFSHDNWTGQEALAAGLSCTKTTSGVTNRFVVITGDTTLPVVCWDECGPCGSSNVSNVTFQVDMNSYTGAFTTPEVNGIFNGWCGSCIPMTDADMDGVWEVTVPITDDSTEYKFSFDNWTGQEALLAGSTCTKTIGANTNRFVVLTGDTVLPPVCWESCGPCSAGPVSASVTFQVDLSSYSGTYTTVNLNGTFNNWCGACAVMTSPNNDDIYELTITVPTDSSEYKFTLDGWTTEENLTEGSPCTISSTDGMGATFTNRIIAPTGDTVMPAVCWESCATCAPLGINDNLVTDFSISPNPSNGIINISATLNQVGEYSMVVVDLQGRVIYEKVIRDNNINENIDLSFAESGLYILNIVGNETVVSERLMITE